MKEKKKVKNKWYPLTVWGPCISDESGRSARLIFLNKSAGTSICCY